MRIRGRHYKKKPFPSMKSFKKMRLGDLSKDKYRLNAYQHVLCAPFDAWHPGHPSFHLEIRLWSHFNFNVFSCRFFLPFFFTCIHFFQHAIPLQKGNRNPGNWCIYSLNTHLITQHVSIICWPCSRQIAFCLSRDNEVIQTVIKTAEHINTDTMDKRVKSRA